jgi:Tol biopolymer transport system component
MTITYTGTYAYPRQCTVYAIQVDKTEQPASEPKAIASIENCGEPFASPDGRYLAVPQATGGLSKPFILDLESGKEWPVFDPEIWPEGWIEGTFHDWHPDSRHILFHNEYTLDRGLWLVDIHTGEYSVLAGGSSPNGGAAVSPDGTRVVFARDDEVWIVSLDGSRRERLDAPVGYVRGWSPDGNWILSTGGGVHVSNVLDGRHVQLDPDVTGREEGSLPPVPGNMILANMLAAWSPDGRMVAVTQVLVPKGAGADFDPFETGNIYLMDASGGRKWPLLSEGTGLSAAWSPDGAMLVFLSKRSGSTEVWVANADGTGLRQLTHEGAARQFVPYYAPIWISSGR